MTWKVKKEIPTGRTMLSTSKRADPVRLLPIQANASNTLRFHPNREFSISVKKYEYLK